MRAVLLVAFVLPSACATVATPARPIVPRVDYHQHLVSPAFAPIAELPERNGAALLRELDASGIYFDVATADQAARAASRIREVGTSRVLYGSDLTPAGGSIRRGWEIFRAKVPLTEEEFRRIAENRTRFAR
jgi:hypothetical protein